MDTHYIDFVLLHWPGANTIQDRIESYKALEECKDNGKNIKFKYTILLLVFIINNYLL